VIRIHGGLEEKHKMFIRLSGNFTLQ